ncbi:hypothetical protein [Ruminococcus sp.]|uniref:hypothetical protein n=1 Tax=Ruminococcus sp. TaxID=41978 RepID=UPI0025E2A5C2|nr:hypothetical protein [Ruminococcus sp.]
MANETNENMSDDIKLRQKRRRKKLSSAVMGVSGVVTAVLAIPVIVFAIPLYVVIKSADKLIKFIERP